MLLTPRIAAILLVLFAVIGFPATSARDLTFEERVSAQEAIERVHHSHRIGASRSFEQTVSRDLLEKKVRLYLRQSAALEKVWHTSVTADLLHRELERISRDTLMPDRLHELYAALDDDSFLIQECLVRPIVVDRLARSFFDQDKTIHADARRRAEALRQALLAGRIDAAAEHRLRVETSIRRRGGTEPPSPDARELSAEEFDRLRSALKRSAGRVGPLRESREEFRIRVLLQDEPAKMRLAGYFIKKETWDEWIAEIDGRLDWENVDVVSSADVSLPDAGAGRCATTSTRDVESGIPCDVWDNGALDEIPDPREGHTMIWTGTEVLLWGGTSWGAPGFDVACPAGKGYDPVTDTWRDISRFGEPPARAGHTAVWTGDEMIVWGGGDCAGGGFFGADIGRRYDPLTDTWSPVAEFDLARGSHTAVWTGGEMIVWGGGTFGSNTGARYDPDTDTWTSTTTVGAPAPRGNHLAVWTGQEMIVYGGEDTNTEMNTGGRYDPATDSWTPTSTATGTATTDDSAVWTGDEMIVWSGAISRRYSPDTDTWTSTSTIGAPALRRNHIAVWTGDEMIIWGGTNPGTVPSILNTGGRYDPVTDTWTPTSMTNVPDPRYLHAAVWTGDLMVVWSGRAVGGVDDNGGRYDPATDTWTPTSVGSGPSPRTDHTAVWTGSEMIVWGGYDGNELGSGGRYDPAIDSWTPTSMTGAPQPRMSHTAAWTGDEMIVWGGASDSTGGHYDPLADSWTPTSTTNAPTPRSFHTAVWTGGEMIVWGGSSQDTGGRYEPVARTWSATSTTNAPSGRRDHTAVWTGDEMIVWGGTTSFAISTALDTGGRYDPDTNSWTPTSVGNSPSPRTEHTATWTGDRMVVWGGREDDTNYVILNDGGRYDPAADTWSATNLTGAPFGRRGHTAIWTGKEVVVWSGEILALKIGSGWYDTGGRYDPLTDSWVATTIVDAPQARVFASAVWTGESMIVWGGKTGARLRSGGSYIPEDLRDQDSDGASRCDGDCDDADDLVFPGAPQLCDGLNNDCDDASWPDVPAVEADDDGDSYRVCHGDCDDTRPDVFPGAPEFCDGVDNDCDGSIDEDDIDADSVPDCVDNCPPFNPVQADQDGDGIGNLCDTCPAINDPTQTDTDNDGRGDPCDCQPGDPGDREPGVVTDLTLTRLVGGGAMLSWTTVAGTDVYSVSRDDLLSLGANQYGTCLVNGLLVEGYEDPEIPPPGTGFFYLVQGQNFECGMGALGYTSDEVERTNQQAGACTEYPHTDVHAESETNVYGTVTGDYLNTGASDGTIEAIEEESTSGNPSTRISRLEHRWTFTVPSGSRVEFHVVGSRTASPDGDDFIFEYSTDSGTTWNPVTVGSLPLTEDTIDLVSDLPSELTGVVLIRVVDTDRSPGNTDLDTLSIDELFVRIVP